MNPIVAQFEDVAKHRRAAGEVARDPGANDYGGLLLFHLQRFRRIAVLLLASINQFLISVSPWWVCFSSCTAASVTKQRSSGALSSLLLNSKKRATGVGSGTAMVGYLGDDWEALKFGHDVSVHQERTRK
ncbi:MAG: hypothetical protein CL543_12625 [Alcanivorax sp.]|nr:hypothetical protein [Alcanivorax sp.]